MNRTFIQIGNVVEKKNIWKGKSENNEGGKKVDEESIKANNSRRKWLTAKRRRKRNLVNVLNACSECSYQ